MISVSDFNSTTSSIMFKWDRRDCMKAYSVTCIGKMNEEIKADLNESELTGVCNQLTSNYNYTILPWSETKANLTSSFSHFFTSTSTTQTF